MAEKNTYKGFDLKKLTVYDIASDNQPALPTDFETELDEETERIALLYLHADFYKLSDLKSKLEELYPEELLSLS